MTVKEILQHAGTKSHEQAIEKAPTEYSNYKEKTKNQLSQVKKDFYQTDRRYN
jgi:hypothetical protein